MAIELDDLDEIGIIGQPYHGLWKAGYITQPNGSTKACPAPVNDGVTLLRVPGLPAVSRGTDEAAADTAAGREWRTYALISGGCYGGSGPVIGNDGAAYIWYIDPAKVRWLMRLERGNTAGQFFLKLRRFGHFDGTTSGWSTAIQITLSPELWYQIYGGNRLMTVAQNTTGSEFVLGVRNFPDGEYAIALAKINVSGTVNLAAGNRGLGFASASIEWPTRLNDRVITNVVITGTVVYTQTRYYGLRRNADHVMTGTTYTQVLVSHDDVPFSDNGEPPAVSGHTWVTISPTTWEGSSDKLRQVTSELRSKRTIWATYNENDLVLWSLEAAQVQTTSEPLQIIIGAGSAYSFDTYPTNEDSVRGLISRANDTVVHNFEWTTSNVYGGPVDNFPYEFAASNSSSDTTLTASSVQSVINVWSEFFMDGASPRFRATYVIPTRNRGQNFANPLMLKVQMIRDSGYSTGTLYPISLHAPSGTEQATTHSWADLYASWQPVLDVIAQDTVPICWF